jgi:drug/metabolite transporter (DMT)-like permease
MKTLARFAPLLALTTALISGTSNFLNKIAVSVVRDPVAFTFLKNALVGAAILGILLITLHIKEVRTLSKADAWRLVAVGVVGGSIPFILFFTGLTMTSALTASFIHKTLFFWVALLAIPFLKERIGWMQGAALFLLLGGTFLLGGFQNMRFGTGELLVLLATIFWAVENIIAKKALANVSSLLLAGSRMVIGSVVLFGVVAFQGNLALLTGFTPIQWWWTIFPSVLLLGYVLTWYTALKYLPATMTASLLVPASILTTLLSAVFLHKTLSGADIASAALIAIAVALLLTISQRRVRIAANLEPGHPNA